jgi:hypothetical protein
MFDSKLFEIGKRYPLILPQLKDQNKTVTLQYQFKPVSLIDVANESANNVDQETGFLKIYSTNEAVVELKSSVSSNPQIFKGLFF